METLTNDLQDFIKIILYYKDTYNDKTLKIFIHECLIKITNSNKYKSSYETLNNHNNINEQTDITNKLEQNDITMPFANPHFLQNFVHLLYFCYPRIPIKKISYHFLIHFFIYSVNNKHHWSSTKYNLIQKETLYLISKYSNHRKNIYFNDQEKNKYYIHILLKKLLDMNEGMEKLIDYAMLDYKKYVQLESIKTYLTEHHYQSRKESILNIICRHIKIPKLCDIYTGDIMNELFINTLNYSFFHFIPKKFIKFFIYENLYQLILSTSTLTSEMYKSISFMYEYFYNLDKSQGTLLAKDAIIFQNSFILKIIKEPQFFKLSYLNKINLGKAPQKEKFFLQNIFHDICSATQTHCQQLNKLNSININYSEEFLDPIMKTEIKEPLFLPNSEILMDKTILEQMLLHSNTNPFTREPLYMSDIKSFNNKKEIKEKIEQFLKTKQQFRENYLKEKSNSS
jgi:hypothetical protein